MIWKNKTTRTLSMLFYAFVLVLIISLNHGGAKADDPTYYTYTGTVTDQIGEPLSNVQVQLYSTTGGPTEVSGYTDSSGNFGVSAPSGTYNVEVTDQGENRNGAQTIGDASVSDFSTDTITTVNLSSSSVTQNLAITLQQLTIGVNNGSGNPEQNVNIKANGNGGTFNISDGTSNYTPSGNTLFNARTSQSGTAIVLVPEGSLFPAATASSGTNTGICVTYNDGTPACNTSPVTVSSDMNLDFNEPPTYTYSGTLTDQYGDPLTNVNVELVPIGGTIVYSGTVGSNGQFGVTAPEGTYDVELNDYNVNNLSVEGDSLSWFYTGIITTTNLTQGNQTQTLSLALSRVTVDVTGSSGNPEGGREVFSAGSGATMTVNSDGTNYTALGNTELQGVYTDDYGSVTIFVPEGTTFNAATPTSGRQYGVCVLYLDNTVSCSNVAITVTSDISLFLEEGSTSVVAIGSPANVTATSPTAVPVISWNRVSEAAYYNIYRSGVEIGTTTGTSFTDTAALYSGAEYDYYITAVDTNGVESAPSDYVGVIVDTTPPTITYTLSPSPDSAGWNNTPVTVTFNCNDSTAGISFCPPPVTLTTDGANQTVTGTATNNLGNSSTVTATVNIDQTSSTLGTASWNANPISYGETTNLSVPVSTNSISGVVAGEYFIGTTDPGEGNGTSMTFDGSNLNASLGSNLLPGTYQVNIRALDAAGNWSPVVTTNLVISGAQPTITSADSYSLGMRQIPNFTVTTAGAPTAAFTETGTLPSGVTFVDNDNGTASFDGMAAAGTAGTYPITITATNVVGSVTQNFTLTITTATSAPTITSATSVTAAFGQAMTPFTVTTTGYAAPSLSETTPLPSGLSFHNNGNGTATISGTPSGNAEGVYIITIKAKNSAGTVTQTFTITVTRISSFTSIPSNELVATVGSNYSLTTTATGYPVPAMTESGNLPSGLTFTDNDNGTATISGVPAAGTGGTYSITLTATNSSGSTNYTITLTVDEAPTISSANNITVTFGQAMTPFTVTTTSYPAATLSESSPLPSGLNFHNNGNGTATISGTPSGNSNGTQKTITITASNNVGTSATQTFTISVD